VTSPSTATKHPCRALRPTESQSTQGAIRAAGPPGRTSTRRTAKRSKPGRMGAPAYLSTDTAARRAAETSEMRNASVDEYAARKGACAQVHLPTGRMCTCRTVTGGRATSSQPTRRTRPFLFTGPTAGKGPPDDKDGSGDDAARHTVCLGADGCVGPDPVRQPPGRATCLQDLPGVLAGQLPWSPGPCQRPGPGAKRTVARRALVPASIKVSHVDTRHGLSVIAEVRDLTGGDEAGR
jgi:hypothetical protein